MIRKHKRLRVSRAPFFFWESPPSTTRRGHARKGLADDKKLYEVIMVQVHEELPR